MTEKDSALFPELVEYLQKKKQSIPAELLHHKSVREASQLSKYKDESEETNPTEFKMILTVFFR